MKISTTSFRSISCKLETCTPSPPERSKMTGLDVTKDKDARRVTAEEMENFHHMTGTNFHRIVRNVTTRRRRTYLIAEVGKGLSGS